MAADVRLPVLALPGLSPDSLGNYLASLGLLRVLSRRWPSTRLAWRDEVLQMVGGPSTLDDLVDEMVHVASSRAWTPYIREWRDAQAKSSELAQKPKTKATSGVPFALWQAQAAEHLLEGFAAHVVPHGAGRSMNPILGKAGKIGQRDFAKGWQRAVDLLVPPKPSKPGKNETPAKKSVRERSDSEAETTAAKRKGAELKALLEGAPLSWLEKDLNGATWFSQANKLYNSGQRAYRDGFLSPWLMILACEGLLFLSGGSSRRLGARTRSVGAFPFT
jgi:CRISPR-associated protein Csx17